MNFSRAPGGPVTTGPPARGLPLEEPSEEPVPEIPPVLGPADGTGAPPNNPFSVEAPGLDVAALAAALHWRL